MIPELVRAARHGPEPQRVLAVTALATITGWDARFDADRPRATVITEPPRTRRAALTT